LLAVGQRRAGLWGLESMLLTEPPADAIPLDLGRDDTLRRAAEEVIGRIHEAGYELTAAPEETLGVQRRGGEAPRVVLTRVEGVRRKSGRDGR
jgi:hypothetical protein